MKKTNNNLKFTDKILGGKYDSTNVTWDHSGNKNGGYFNANGDVYDVQLMSDETTDQLVITVTSKRRYVIDGKGNCKRSTSNQYSAL